MRTIGGAAWLLLAGLVYAADQPAATIRFEDVTAASGIQFTHSFGARKLGSLLESTGSGCVWFDYNNDGLPDLYVASGKPLGDDIHPYPLRQPPPRRRTITSIATTATANSPTSRSRRASARTCSAWPPSPPTSITTA